MVFKIWLLGDGSCKGFFTSGFLKLFITVKTIAGISLYFACLIDIDEFFGQFEQAKIKVSD